MANVVKYNSRIVMKHDTKEHWDLAVNFIPLAGEIIVYDDLKKIKVGDGITNVSKLPFQSELYVGETQPTDPGIYLWLDTSVGVVEERLEGDGQEFHTMAPSTLTFRSTAPLDELQGVQINGQTVDPSNYELEEGSTIVKLKYDYLSTLDVGQYELSIVSDSKTAKGDFTVAAPILNEYGFYYDHPYYINDVDVGDFGNSVILSGAFMISTNNTVYVLNVEADTLSEETLTCENNIYTFKFSGATITGAFTSNGASFVTSEVFIAGGGWMPDYSGNDRVEFTLNTEAVCGDGEYVYYYSNSYDTLVAIPVNNKKSSYNLPKTHIRDNAVTGFAPSAFSSNTELTSITIPSGFTNVLRYTFEDCSSLVSVMIPDSVTSIGERAFYGCTSLRSITIPDSVTSIGQNAFDNCTGLTSVTIGNSVTSIGKSAFGSCTSLRSITIPDSVTSIGERAFVSARLANITFKGTISQWNAITKGDEWNYGAVATYVQCSDGQVAL